MALLFLASCKAEKRSLIIYNKDEKGNIQKEVSYPIKYGDHFSVEFTHSVNMSPVIEYYKFDKAYNIYVYETRYYNYGAGVLTNIEGNETIEYGDDGSMIIKGIDKKIDNLSYYLSDIYDHTLQINDNDPISLWGIFGKNTIIYIKSE